MKSVLQNALEAAEEGRKWLWDNAHADNRDQLHDAISAQRVAESRLKELVLRPALLRYVADELDQVAHRLETTQIRTLAKDLRELADKAKGLVE